MTRARIMQPTEFSCGQTCVAMITGHTPEEVLAWLPDKRTGTRAKQLASYLNANGWLTGERLERYYPGKTILPPLAILRYKWPDRALGHWVLWDDGEILDPTMGTKGGWKITSFLRVGPCLNILRNTQRKLCFLCDAWMPGCECAA